MASSEGRCRCCRCRCHCCHCCRCVWCFVLCGPLQEVCEEVVLRLERQAKCPPQGSETMPRIVRLLTVRCDIVQNGGLLNLHGGLNMKPDMFKPPCRTTLKLKVETIVKLEILKRKGREQPSETCKPKIQNTTLGRYQTKKWADVG